MKTIRSIIMMNAYWSIVGGDECRVRSKVKVGKLALQCCELVCPLTHAIGRVQRLNPGDSFELLK